MWNETEVYDVLWDTYGDSIADGDRDQILNLNSIVFGAVEEGIEDEMIAFAHEHPDASLQEVTLYYLSFVPPLEYTDEEVEEEDDGEEEYDYSELYRPFFQRKERKKPDEYSGASERNSG